MLIGVGFFEEVIVSRADFLKSKGTNPDGGRGFREDIWKQI